MLDCVTVMALVRNLKKTSVNLVFFSNLMFFRTKSKTLCLGIDVLKPEEEVVYI